MLSDRPIVDRCLKLASVYLLVLAVVLVWWGSLHGQMTGGFVPLWGRLLLGLWSATGPFALAVGVLPNPFVIRTIAFFLIWAIWLSIVFVSPMRNWSLLIHLLMASAWCLSGLLQASIVIT